MQLNFIYLFLIFKCLMMKKISRVFLCVFIFGFYNSFGQSLIDSVSLYESRYKTTNRIFKEQTRLVGKINDLRLYSIKQSDISTGDVFYTALLTKRQSFGFGLSSNEGGIYIDFEDSEPIIKTLEKFNAVISEKNTDNSPAYYFRSNYNIYASCMWLEDYKPKDWLITMSRGKYQSCIIKKSELPEIISLIKEYRSVKY